MNPYFIAAAFASLFGRKRTCPKCRRDQLVSSSKKHKSVSCKFCGAEIPPPKTTGKG